MQYQLKQNNNGFQIRCAKNYKGTEFTVMDMKALIIQLYDGAAFGTVFAGSRCNEANIATDQYGRAKDPTCRDVAPDLFHIIITNLMGRLKKGFGMHYYFIFI